MHVDAYRLGGVAELDDLDLDTSLDDAVTVVEWGEGIAEGLADDRVEVRIERALADEPRRSTLDPRRVRIAPVGARWLGVRRPAPELSSEVSAEQPHRLGEQHDVRVLGVVDPKPRGRVGDRESTYLHHGLAVVRGWWVGPVTSTASHGVRPGGDRVREVAGGAARGRWDSTR